MSMIIGTLVWLGVGVPLAGFALWILTIPFRAARAFTRRPRRAVWDDHLGQYRWTRR